MEVVCRKDTKDLVGFEAEPEAAPLFVELYRRRILSDLFPEDKTTYFAQRIIEITERAAKKQNVQMALTMGVVTEILQIQDTYDEDVTRLAKSNFSLDQFRTRLVERTHVQQLAEQAIMAFAQGDSLLAEIEARTDPTEPN